VSTFDDRFLRCRSDSSTPMLSPLRELSFIPGPAPVRGTCSSVDVHSVASYPIDSVRRAFCSFAGVTESTVGGDAWLFEWRSKSRTLLVDLEPFENDEWPFWSGSSLQADCLFSDLLEFWIAIAQSLPRVWLHNADCTMFSPSSFVTTVAAPAVAVALESADSSVQHRAKRELARYEELVSVFEELGGKAV
jgi:hypothetical protein